MTSVQDTVDPEMDEPCKGELPVVHEVNNVDMYGGRVRGDKLATSGGGKQSVLTFANIPSEDPRDKKCRVAQLKSRIAVFRRTRSLNAPSPVYQFGPCGRILKNSAMVM
ncbi:hypothetical protein HPB50_018294 [Hyalomma asiaticum]|uniref:Uncharacterized protein n=1 Tax=Hyalomma asiaticum TaxID=266040 RepID=A0ACB7SGR1_HYAAI|nr:hypothetical protein HPB50_018294 [Hyalomma asiaticum]